jgi:hypothetical protein
VKAVIIANIKYVDAKSGEESNESGTQIINTRSLKRLCIIRIKKRDCYMLNVNMKQISKPGVNMSPQSLKNVTRSKF